MKQVECGKIVGRDWEWNISGLGYSRLDHSQFTSVHSPNWLAEETKKNLISNSQDLIIKTTSEDLSDQEGRQTRLPSNQRSTLFQG